MITSYAKYKNGIYELERNGDVLELISTNPEDLKNGFSYYENVLGETQDDFL